MTEPDNPLLRARETAEADAENAQARNRLWWERLPMTYADWESDDRLPAGPEELKRIEDHLFAASPFLRGRFDFTRFRGQRVLDIGCGTGVLSCRFAKDGADVTAMDLTATAVALARRNAQAQGLAVETVQGDAENMAFSPDHFDFVFSWGVLHHTSDTGQAFKEVRRVLKPGGGGLIMVYHRHSVVYYVHGLYWLLAKGKIFSGHTLRTVQDFYTDGYYHRYLTGGEITGLLRDAGLTTRKITVTQYEKKILPWIPSWLDEFLKARFGMCLIAEFEKPAE